MELMISMTYSNTHGVDDCASARNSNYKFVGVNFDPTYLIIGAARHRNGITSLTKQLAFRDVSTGFPAKWRLRKRRGNIQYR